jgi:hypothetical protein
VGDVLREWRAAERSLAELTPDTPHWERTLSEIDMLRGRYQELSARVQTLGVFALLVGTLQVSRALTDQRLADELLERGIQNALALLAS